MRPTVRFLGDELIERIVAEARQILGQLGVEGRHRHVRVPAQTRTQAARDELLAHRAGVSVRQVELAIAEMQHVHALPQQRLGFVGHIRGRTQPQAPSPFLREIGRDGVTFQDLCISKPPPRRVSMRFTGVAMPRSLP